MIDVGAWLAPLNGANPSGEELRNDARFHEIERLLEPQVTVSYDDRNRPVSQVSAPVDWSTVLAKATELRASGRDLRLLVIVTRALANEQGLDGLAKGLELIASSLDAFWDSLHPVLRSGSPREAALRRTNALLDLQNGQSGLLADLRRRTLFTSPGIGPVTGRDLEQAAIDDRIMLQEAASGLNAAERAALSKAHEQLIARVRTATAAFADRSGADLAALREGARAVQAALARLDATINGKLGTTGPTVPELDRFIERACTTLDRAAAGSEPAGAAAEGGAAAKSVTGNGVANGFHPAPAGSGGAGLPDRIASREDVVKCLDLVVAFYDRTEPSSPIPHLARRVRRMVHMDFVELMEDLAPSGLKEFRMLAGLADKDNKRPAQKDER